MAKRVVVTSTLTDEMIAAGARLLERLDEVRMGIPTAFWSHQPDSNTWRLILAVPGLKSTGPLHSYNKILEIQATLPHDEPTVDVEDITVVDANEPVVAALGKANRIHPVFGGRQPRMVLRGIYLEESYIYRIEKPLAVPADS